jgi:hypothetical protein
MIHLKKTLFVIIPFLLFVMNTNDAFSQNYLESAPYTKYIVKENNTDYFLISTKPVTNREYIIYLIWLNHIYGTDYIENFVREIPRYNQAVYSNLLGGHDFDFNNIPVDSAANPLNKVVVQNTYKFTNPFETIIKYSEPFVRLYMFNPKYIDYPVIGVSWLQANHYCKWLSDRYNENVLVQKGYLKADPMQFNENCFTTESYLANQYEGYPIKPEKVKWKINLFIPAFHLPTEKEIDLAKKEKMFQQEFKSYASDTKSFLDQWQRWYFKVNENALVLSPDSMIFPTYTIKSPEENWDIGKYKYEELRFDMDISNPNFKNILDQKNQKTLKSKDWYKEKNEFGDMQYMIIDENTSKEPIVVEKYSNPDPVKLDSAKFYFFRFSGIMKPKQYGQ